MHRQSIQTVVFSFLDYRDLIACSKVCKVFNETSKNQLFWIREFMTEFVPEAPFPRCGSANWRQMFLEGLKLRSEWFSEFRNAISDEEAHSMCSELFSSLTRPDLCLPPLRREVNCFPTIIQDFLGNPNDISEAYVSSFEKLISSNRLKMMAELRNNREISFLDTTWEKWIKKRGLTVNRDSNSTVDSDFTIDLEPEQDLEKYVTYTKDSQSFIGKILMKLESTVAYFCKINCIIIDNSENPIENYVERWNLYSSCIAQLNCFFLPFTDLVSEVHGRQRLTVIDIMVETWKEEVWGKLEHKLTSCFLKEIENQRRAMLGFPQFSSEDSSLCYGFFQALCDISFTTYNVYYKDHSNLRLPGTLENFSDEIFRTSILFYKSLSIPEMVKTFEIENAFLANICLRSTYLQVLENRQLAIKEELSSCTQKYKLQFQEIARLEQLSKQIDRNRRALYENDKSIENIAGWMGFNGDCLVNL